MSLLDKIKKLLADNKGEIEVWEKEYQAEMQKQLQENKKKNADKKLVYIGEVSNIEVQVKKASNGGEYLIVKGIASNSMPDRGNDVVDVNGLITPNAINNQLPMLKQHEDDQVLGHWYSWGVVNGQFIVEGKLMKSYDPIAYEQVKNGDLNALSIAGKVLEWAYDDMNQDITILKKVELLEVSLVAIGMHQNARVIGVEIGSDNAQKDIKDIKDINKSNEVVGEPEAEVPVNTDPVVEDAPVVESVVEDANVKPEAEAEPVIDVNAIVEELEKLKQENAELNELLEETNTLLLAQSEALEKKYDFKK